MTQLKDSPVTAAIRQLIIDSGLGSHIVDGGIYANPVWKVRYAGMTGAIPVLATGVMQAIISNKSTKGDAESIAVQLKSRLGSNQRIWITDTHLVFAGSDSGSTIANQQIQAAVPLNNIIDVKKALRLQLLARFKINFTDSSSAAFMSWGKDIKRLRQALDVAKS